MHVDIVRKVICLYLFLYKNIAVYNQDNSIVQEDCWNILLYSEKISAFLESWNANHIDLELMHILASQFTSMKTQLEPFCDVQFVFNVAFEMGVNNDELQELVKACGTANMAWDGCYTDKP